MWGEVLKTYELFKQFLDEVKENVSPSTYSVWFNDLELVSMNDKEVVIKVPLQLHKNILRTTHIDLFNEIFFSLTGINYNFKFVTQDEIEDTKDLSSIVEAISKQEDTEQTVKWNTNLNPNLNFDNYVVGESNRLAFISAMNVAQTPGTIRNPLFIYGRSGIGKTHLMHAIGNYITEHSNKKVLYTTSNDFRDEYTGISKIEKGQAALEYANNFKNKYRNVDVLIIDDIQFLVGAEKTQQEFFHTFEALHQANKQIIISSDRSPDDLKLLEERLRSRFMWGLPVDIYPPDFELRCKIIQSKLKNMTIRTKIDENVIEYIANNCQNDVRFLEGALNRLMAYTAMMVPETVDLNFAIEALADFVNHNRYATSSIEGIQKAVAEYYKITVEDLKGKKRSANIAYPRMVAMYLVRTLTEENLNRIGLEFGGRDHSTVIHACDKITQDLKEKVGLEATLKEIQNKM